MESYKEDFYKINDIVSWVHCIYAVHESNPHEETDTVGYHYHEYIELLLFTKGQGRVLVNEQSYGVSPGMMLIVNSNKAHVVIAEPRCEYYVIKMLPRILSDRSLIGFNYVMPFIDEGKNVHIFSAEQTEKSNLLSLFDEIQREWDLNRIGSELLIWSDILRIFTSIFRIWEDEGREMMTEFSQGFRKAVLYINEHYQTVNEKEIAELCGFSYNYVSKLFRIWSGKSFKEYLTSVRLSAAEKLLLSSDLSVTEVAYTTGFATASHFIKIFVRSKNITPAKYRSKFRRIEK